MSCAPGACPVLATTCALRRTPRRPSNPPIGCGGPVPWDFSRFIKVFLVKINRKKRVPPIWRQHRGDMRRCCFTFFLQVVVVVFSLPFWAFCFDVCFPASLRFCFSDSLFSALPCFSAFIVLRVFAFSLLSLTLKCCKDS